MFILVRYESYDGWNDEGGSDCSLERVCDRLEDAQATMRRQFKERMTVETDEAKRYNGQNHEDWHDVDGFVRDRSAMVNVTDECTEWFILDTTETAKAVSHSFRDMDC